MKQQKLTGYRPNYPRKALRGAVLTAAALVAMGSVAGCQKPEPSVLGLMDIVTPPPEELVLSGDVAIPEPTEEPVLLGKIAVTEPPEEELVLSGEVAVFEPEPTPEVPFQITGVLLMPTATPEA